MQSLLEKELAELIVKIVDIIQEENIRIEVDIKKWKLREENLEKLAKITELKIQKSAVKQIRKKVLLVLKGSTNRLIISTIKPAD